MPRTVKPRDDTELDNFFAGVAEMRAYLDRHRQDPERRRARLGKLAAELLRPRDGKALAESVTAQLAQALGARAAALAVNPAGRTSTDASGWRIAHQIGEPQATIVLAEAAAKLARESRAQAQPLLPVCFEGGLLVPLLGVDRLAGALWLDGCQPLDDASMLLLQAIADTAGVAIEQSLVMESMA